MALNIQVLARDRCKHMIYFFHIISKMHSIKFYILKYNHDSLIDYCFTSSDQNYNYIQQGNKFNNIFKNYIDIMRRD
jgi:hypothetical protein